jgi:hypothetical protein
MAQAKRRPRPSGASDGADGWDSGPRDRGERTPAFAKLASCVLSKPKVDSEKHERPEEDRQDCGEDPLHFVEVVEVVALRGDYDADDDIDEAENARGAHRLPAR